MANAVNVSNEYKCLRTEYHGEADDTYVRSSTKRRDELDAEIAALEAEIAASKTKRNNQRAALEAGLAAASKIKL
jgi:septal ring factor EnvC (AmiA/AmiB activator)